MAKSSLHHTTSAKRHAHAARIARRAGYASGGAIDEGDKEAVHKHESHLHKGEPKTKLKSGGMAPGKKPAQRMDKRARGGSNGDPEIYDEKPRRDKFEKPLKNVNTDSEGPPKRAHGGRNHGKGKTNIIIHAGGGDQQNPMALQQAKQEGAKMGAMAVIQKIKGAQGGAPGAMPPGAGAPPPPMAAPPPGGMPGAPPPMPMHKDGGVIEGELDARKAGPERLERMKKTGERKGEISVRAHTRKRGGVC